MRKRNIHVSLWLNDEELRHLKEQSDLYGLKQSEFLRNLILHQKMKPRPPDAWGDLVRQVAEIGNDVRQITRIARTRRNISPESVAEVHNLLMAIWKRVRDL